MRYFGCLQKILQLFENKTDYKFVNQLLIVNQLVGNRTKKNQNSILKWLSSAVNTDNYGSWEPSNIA